LATHGSDTRRALTFVNIGRFAAQLPLLMAIGKSSRKGKSAPLLEKHDRARKLQLAGEAWAAVAKRCYELNAAGKVREVREVRKLLTEMERLRNLIESLQPKVRRK
jgi:hypothetical protein